MDDLERLLKRLFGRRLPRQQRAREGPPATEEAAAPAA